MLREGAGRPATRFARAALGPYPDNQRRVHKDKRGPRPHQLLIRAKPARFSVQGINRSSGLARSCALPTWWLWRGGRTRSLSEHGRETPLRPWYFVLRRGRVGRCQVCQTQLQAKLLKQFMPRFMKMKQSQSSHHTSGSGRVTIGRSQAAFVASGNKLIPFPRNMGAREHAINPSGLRWIETINPKGLRPWRGVEQPGSSSGS